MERALARTGPVPRIETRDDPAVRGLSPLALGRYRPLKPLGTGGSGSVWLAQDERTGLEVALKIVPLEGKAGSRAEREAEAAARLRHPTCLRAYAFGRERGHVFIATEYAPGRTFRDTLRAGRLSDANAIEACAQLAEGLAHAHRRGVLHRDVKPANVLLVDAPELSVRLLDFGLAAFAEADTLTAQGDVPGTLAYISPERLAGEPATAAADVWAVGVMLWEALAGRHPFTRPSLRETGEAIEAGAPSLATVRPDLPKPLVAAVDHALAPDPRRRPSAAWLADALRERRTLRPGRVSSSVTQTPARLAHGVAAGVYAGATAALLPFWPAGFALALGAVAAALAFARPRVGLAFALAVAAFPLGNLSLGLVVGYGVAAVAFLALARRRELVASTAVLLVYAFFRPPDATLAREDDPLVAAREVVTSLDVAAWRLAAVAALLAAALPYARTPWRVAFCGAAAVAASVLPNPNVPAWALIAAVWTTCIVWAVKRAT
jgi:Protein kinase domain